MKPESLHIDGDPSDWEDATWPISNDEPQPDPVPPASESRFEKFK